MGSFSIWHWLIVLLIVVMVFGTKKLKNMGSDLGGAVKGFKNAVKDGEAESEETAVVYGMPGSAVRAGVVNESLPLHAIGDFVALLA